MELAGPLWASATHAFEKGRSDDTVLSESLCTQTAGKVLLVWDRARWHTSEEVQGALDRIGRIQPLLLPARPP